MNGLRSAVGFLTILPLAPPRASDGMASARGWFPLVGLLLGAALVGIDLLFTPLSLLFPLSSDTAIYQRPAFPPLLSAALIVVALAVLTRGLHLDGLMDSADALLGGFTRDRRLAILRDPNVGAFAVISLVCVMLIKVIAVSELPPLGRVSALLLFPCLSRWAMLLTMERYPYARRRGLGTAFLRGRGKRQLALGLAVALFASAALAGIYGIALLAAASALAWGIGAWATRLLGGVTGDIYGAVNEITETALLVMMIALMAYCDPFALQSPLIWALWQAG